MRRISVLFLASAIAAVACATPTMASTTGDPARTKLAAPVPPGCPVDGFAINRGLAANDGPSQGWPRPRREAFGRLLVAAERFAGAVALHETDRSLSPGSCDFATAQAVERHVFRRTLDMLVANADPQTPLVTAREADGALNAAYSEVMAVDDPRNLAWGSVEKAGIRKAERAWLAYRDAFVAFAATYETPGIAERVKIELTMHRATSLEAFLAD